MFKNGKKRNNYMLVKKIFRISFVSFVSGLIFLLPIFEIYSYDKAPSDPKETIIKKVLIDSGAAFGYDSNYFFVSTLNDGSTKNVYPKVWGPRQMFHMDGDSWVNTPGAGYGFDVVVPQSGNGNTWGQEETLFKIMAYPTEEISKQFMNESLAIMDPKYTKVTDFHGIKALKTFEILEWRMGRFLLLAKPIKHKQTISAEEVAEKLYSNVIKSGLVNAEGYQNNSEEVIAEELIKPKLVVDAKPVFFSKINDTVSINTILTGEDGTGKPGETVILTNIDTGIIVGENTTNSNGKASFKIKHTNVDIEKYHFKVQAMDLTNEITVPVIELGIHLEINPVTGESFKGIVSDGKSTVDIMINLDKSLANGELHISKPPIGKVEGKPVKFRGKIQLTDGKAVIQYIAPSYVKNDAIDLFNENISNGASVVPILFTYTAEDKTKKEFNLEINVYRTPIMLVHGFTGDKTTWSKLSEYLKQQKFDTHIGEYYALDNSIQAQARMLKQNIQDKISVYAQHDIKMSKADIVAHSMGGLISRFYVNNSSYYKNDVRKIIMVGTPNHGCSWVDLQIGIVQSYLGNKHKIAADQLSGTGSFIKNLNRGEKFGQPLKSGVEYGNIYSFSTLPGFFSGDVVVASASAYLNGVSNYMLLDHVHASTFDYLGPAITNSQKVFSKVDYWLTHPINRTMLKNMSIHLSRGTGEVYVKRLNDITNKGIPETSVDTAVQPIKHVSIAPMDYVGTHNGKAMISMYINNIPWGYIQLDANTQLKLGYISPRLIEVKLIEGSARFITFSRIGNGHHSVTIKESNGEWQNITGIDTDFVASVNLRQRVHSIKGNLIYLKETINNEIKDFSISNNQSITVSNTGDIGITDANAEGTSTVKNNWWKNDFYKLPFGGWTTSYLIRLKDTLVSQYTELKNSIDDNSWKDFETEDIAGFKFLGVTLAFCFLLLLILLISIISGKWKALLLIPTLPILFIVFYTVSQIM